MPGQSAKFVNIPSTEIKDNRYKERSSYFELEIKQDVHKPFFN